jgi:ADP-ribosylglycohydrolase
LTAQSVRPNLTVMNIHESQFIGCVVGLAVGDAIGYPAEFRRRQQILDEIGPDGITEYIRLKDSRFSRPFFMGGSDHPPGTFTDDTQMTIAVSEALVSHGHRKLDPLMEEMGHLFVDWSRSEKNDRSPGGTCMEGCANLAKGAPWRTAGVPDSKGCGSAMRVAPIGLFYEDLDKVEDVARASSVLTHGHSAARAGAAAAALMVALALRGLDPHEIYELVDRRCSHSSPDFATTWRKIPILLSERPEDVLTEHALGEGWVAEEAVASAMYCFWRTPDDYSTAILTAINTDGDSDSLGAITGSVIGARLGVDSIPDNWRREVEDSAQLHDLGSRLWQKRELSG